MKNSLMLFLINLKENNRKENDAYSCTTVGLWSCRTSDRIPRDFCVLPEGLLHFVTLRLYDKKGYMYRETKF